MKIKTYIEEANYFSGKASEINRSLTYAGIAIIWIFNNSKNGVIDLPYSLYLPLLLFISSIVIDLLQYVLAYLLWSQYLNNKENRDKSEEDDVREIEWQSVLVDLIWGIKLVVNVIGFVLLLIFLIKNI